MLSSSLSNKTTGKGWLSPLHVVQACCTLIHSLPCQAIWQPASDGCVVCKLWMDDSNTWRCCTLRSSFAPYGPRRLELWRHVTRRKRRNCQERENGIQNSSPTAVGWMIWAMFTPNENKKRLETGRMTVILDVKDSLSWKRCMNYVYS